MTSETHKSGLKVVGTRPIRPDGVEKVTGRANFGADRALPGMLYGKIKRSPHAHARIIRIIAIEAREPPMSGLPEATLTEPSSLTWTCALDSPPTLNQKPQAIPRP